MAEVAISSDLIASAYYRLLRAGPVWTSGTTGYVFYLDTVNGVLKYSKSTDSGATWGTGVTVSSGGNGTAYHADIWYDQWTPGDSGSKIHIVWIRVDGTDDFAYRSLDTSSDTLSTETLLLTDVDSTGQTGWNTGICSITKARGGNLLAATSQSGSGGQYVYRSTDGGANWTTRNTGLHEGAADYYLLLPAGTSDNQDCAAIFWDVSANAISVKMYDDSANTWTETAIVSATESTTYIQMSAAIRHSDNHAILAAWNAVDAVTADLLCYDLTLDSIASPTVTAKTEIITNSSERVQAAVQINQNNDDIYVAYLAGGTFTATVHAVYKVSTNGGTSWGSETQLSTTLDDHRAIYTDLSTKSGSAGRFQPVWINDDLADLVTDSATGVALSAGGVTGTGAVTIDAPSLTGSGAFATTGTGAVTINEPVLAASGTFTPAEITGTGAVTITEPALAATGTLEYAGTAALTITKPVLAGDGTFENVVTGTSALAIGPPSLAGTGAFATTGTGAVTIQAPALAGTGELEYPGTGSVTIGPPSLAGTGQSIDLITGTGAITISRPTLAGSGEPIVTGTGAVTIGAPALAASGTFATTGSGAVTIQAPSLSGTGVMETTGSGAVAIDAPALAATGVFTTTGSGAVTITKPSLSASGTVAEPGTGAGAITISGPSLAGSGGFIGLVTGTGAVSIGAPSLAATGTFATTGTGSVTIGAPSIQGSGTHTPAEITGTGAITISGPALSGSGATEAPATGTGAILISGPSLVGSGTFATTGTGAVSIDGPSLSGAGGFIGLVTGTGTITIGPPSLAGLQVLAVSAAASDSIYGGSAASDNGYGGAGASDAAYATATAADGRG